MVSSGCCFTFHKVIELMPWNTLQILEKKMSHSLWWCVLSPLANASQGKNSQPQRSTWCGLQTPGVPETLAASPPDWRCLHNDTETFLAFDTVTASALMGQQCWWGKYQHPRMNEGVAYPIFESLYASVTPVQVGKNKSIFHFGTSLTKQ